VQHAGILDPCDHARRKRRRMRSRLTQESDGIDADHVRDVAEPARQLGSWREPERRIQNDAAYLRELHDRYGAAGFLTAYNAGPPRYKAHLGTGQPDARRDAGLCQTARSVDRGRSRRRWRSPRCRPAVVDRSAAPRGARRRFSDGISTVTRRAARATFGCCCGHRLTGLAPRSGGLFVARSRRTFIALLSVAAWRARSLVWR